MAEEVKVSHRPSLDEDRRQSYYSFRSRAAIPCDGENNIVGIKCERLSSLTSTESVDEKNNGVTSSKVDDGIRRLSAKISEGITRSSATVFQVITRAINDGVVANMLLQNEKEGSLDTSESSEIRDSTPHHRNAGKYTVIAFINSMSGGGKGMEIFKTLQSLLGNEYVIDLNSCGPGQMPEDTLLKYAHDPSVRILACGGDGTCGWIYSSLDKVWSTILGMKGRVHLSDKYKDHLPLAIMPLGTGNDLSRQYMWGPSFRKSMTKKSFISAVVDADVMGLDRWRCLILPTCTLREDEKKYIPQILCGKDSSNDPPDGERASFATLSGLEGILHDEVTDKKSNKFVTESCQPSSEYFDGLFCNYFSLGFDATVLFEFHKERESNPQKFTSPAKNKLVYVEKSPAAVRAPKLRKRVQIFVNNEEGDLVKLKIPKDTRSILLMNIQSYAGGHKVASKGTPDDGLIEVIFVSNLIRLVSTAAAGPVMPYVLFKVRAQTNRVCIRTKAPLHCQVDGEPWLQGEAVIQVKFHTRNAILKKPSAAMNCGCVSNGDNVVVS